jgi:hypothetical protein
LQLCGRAWLSSASPSDDGVEYLLQMGHGGDVAEHHLGASRFASLTHGESIYRLEPLDLKGISDDDLRRRLRGSVKVESRVTTDCDSSSCQPAKVAANEKLARTEPWRRRDAAQADASSRSMAFLPKPYGQSSGQAQGNALAYRLRMDRRDERFKPMKRGRADGLEAETTAPAAETGSMAVKTKPARTISQVVAASRAFFAGLPPPSTRSTTTEIEPAGTLGRVDGGGDSDGDSDGGSGGDSDGGGGGSRGHGGAGGSQGAAALSFVTLASQLVPAASSAVESPPPPPPPPPPASDGRSVQYEYCLTLLALTTIRQHNYDLRCELFACLLFACLLVLWCCAAAPTAGRVQRCARWLLVRLRPHHLTRERVAACVLVLSHLWSHGCRGAAAQAVCAALVLALRSCPWSERAAGQLIRGLLVQGAVVAHAFAAPTAERLGALELQLFWEIVELLGLHLLVEWARTRLLRWLSRRLHLCPRRLDLEPRRLDLEPTEVD